MTKIISQIRRRYFSIRRINTMHKMHKIVSNLILDCAHDDDHITLEFIHQFLTRSLHWTENKLQKLNRVQLSLKEQKDPKTIQPGEFVLVETYGLPLRKIMELDHD